MHPPNPRVSSCRPRKTSWEKRAKCSTVRELCQNQSCAYRILTEKSTHYKVKNVSPNRNLVLEGLFLLSNLGSALWSVCTLHEMLKISWFWKLKIYVQSVFTNPGKKIKTWSYLNAFNSKHRQEGLLKLSHLFSQSFCKYNEFREEIFCFHDKFQESHFNSIFRFSQIYIIVSVGSVI